MTISIQNLINTIIISIGIGICALNLFQVSVAGERLEKRVRRYFQTFFGSLLVYIGSHLIRQVLDGIPGKAARISLIIFTFAEFVITGFMVYFITGLIVYLTKAKDGNMKPIQIFCQVMLAVHFAIIIATQFVPFVYYFDENNVYQRAAGYLASNAVHIVLLIFDMVLLVRYRSRLKKDIAVSLWVYLVSPLVAMGFQMFDKKIQFIIFATIASAALMYATIMNNLARQYEKQRMENSRIETELNMASGIQRHMLPHIYPAFPEREEFDIYATMTPAKEVGGDFYDFFLLDEEHLGIVMADVSGKGVPAALFMMISKILVENYALIHKDPKQTLEAVNRQICKNNPEEMFVTVWLGILDVTTGTLTAANAGHEYPVVRQAGEDFELIKDKHGFVIGGLDGARYKAYEVCLKPGSKLFLYTDGVVEATNAQEELFGAERMVSALQAAQDGTPKEVLESVNQAVEAFVQDAPQFDDLTMLCLHYKGSKEAAHEAQIG